MMAMVTRRGLFARLIAGVATAGMAITACGGSPSAPSSGATHRIVVLGDSLAVSPSPGQSFPSELQNRLDSGHPGWMIKNAGVIGDTTADGVGRLDRELTSDTAILILELGANDGLRGDSLADMERNLGTIIERTQARSIRVLLCGMETLPTHGVDYALDYHNVFPRVAARYNIPLVPFLLEGVALNPSLNLGDGLHPNAAGAKVVAANVWPYLEPMLK
jgi:acyl-CoA thioesterase-1